MSFRTLFVLAGLLVSVRPLIAQSAVYHYDGDTLPTVGTYADWFTTVGPGHPTGYYFANTTWSSDGEVLTMNTVYPGEGIWFGRTGGYSDPSVGFDLAGTGDGNLVKLRAALSSGATEWSLNFTDTDGYGGSFYLLSSGINYYYLDSVGGSLVTQFLPVADMTQMQTLTSYVLGGQVSYWANNQYLGGGAALSGNAANTLFIGDLSARDHSGTGSLLVDYLTVTTAPTSTPSAVPEPAQAMQFLTMTALAFAMVSRRRIRKLATR
ncbi:MAG: hypothetical protein SynsKO_30140 [Synoicihabitans sp.]